MMGKYGSKSIQNQIKKTIVTFQLRNKQIDQYDSMIFILFFLTCIAHAQKINSTRQHIISKLIQKHNSSLLGKAEEMNRQILEKLTEKDLQNYRNTLKKRVDQLKSFNNQIAQDNSRIINKLNKIAEQQQNQRLLQKKKINKSNFDFDDLYRMGVNKVGKIVNKDGVKNLLSVGEEKIKKGFGYAQNIVKKYMGKNKNENQGVNNNVDNKVRIINQQENVNEHADFNSYDVGNGRHFQHYEPKAQQNLQQPSPTLEQKPQHIETDKKPSIQRKKIFDREQQQQILAKKKMIRQKTPQSSQSQPQHEQKSNKIKSEPIAKQQQPLKFQNKQIKEGSDKKVKNQIKQISVLPNKVIDLEVDEEEQENHEKHATQLKQQKIDDKNQKIPQMQNKQNHEKKQKQQNKIPQK